MKHKELNTCDKCNKTFSTYKLIWITLDDFRPKSNELVPETLYSKYDALCTDCYLEEITILPGYFIITDEENGRIDELLQTKLSKEQIIKIERKVYRNEETYEIGFYTMLLNLIHKQDKDAKYLDYDILKT